MDTKTGPLYMLSTRDKPRNKGHIQTESEELEKDIPHKQRTKEMAMGSYLSIITLNVNGLMPQSKDKS